MDQVTHRLPPGFVWPTVGHPGRVPLWALVGDPNQPRKHFDDDELDALASTMKSEDGGEQREILTVSELGAEERLGVAPARYRIVSGERRWRAATRARLADIEVRVKAYKVNADRKLDMYMLNEGRVQLSEIENARYLAELMQDFGLTTHEELAKLTGKKLPYVQQHLALLRLVPEVQALMEPSIPERSRLRMSPALVLSRLGRDVQAEYAERMPKGDGVSTRRQVEWIKAEMSRTGAAVATRVRELQPHSVRKSIEYFAERVDVRIGAIYSHKAFGRIFENTSPAQREALLSSVKKMLGRVEGLLEKLESQIPSKAASAPAISAPPLRSDAKATAESFIKQRPQLRKSADLRSPVPPLKPEAQVPRSVNPAPRSTWVPKARTVESAPSVLGGTGPEKTVTYFDSAVNRKVTSKVGRLKYALLYDTGQLGFQIDGKERPEWMPCREIADDPEAWHEACK